MITFDVFVSNPQMASLWLCVTTKVRTVSMVPWGLCWCIPTNSPSFLWDSSGKEKEFCDQITSAYDRVVPWRQNLLMVPFGSAGKEFVIELSKFNKSFSTLESNVLKAAMVMPALLLQWPHSNSKSHDHIHSLYCHFKLWCEGDIQTLWIRELSFNSVYKDHKVLALPLPVTLLQFLLA